MTPVPTASSILSATTATPAATAAAPAPSTLGPSFNCEQCGCTTQFLGTSRAVRLLGVSRSTIYYWMERNWIHWRLLPSGRRIICRASLSQTPRR